MTGQFPSPPRNPGQYRSQQDAASITGKAEGAAGWGRALKPEMQSWGRQGAVGAGAGRGNAQAPWLAAGAGPPRLPWSQSPSRVSGAANLGDPGGGDQQRHPKRRSQEHGGDGRGAAGTGTLWGQCSCHPGPALGACSGPRRDRGGLAGGWACCLRPGCCTAHLRHFPAAAPQTLARAPGEREGGGRRAEGRGRARRSAPQLAPLRPRLAGLRPRRRWAPPF